MFNWRENLRKNLGCLGLVCLWLSLLSWLSWLGDACVGIFASLGDNFLFGVRCLLFGAPSWSLSACLGGLMVTHSALTKRTSQLLWNYRGPEDEMNLVDQPGHDLVTFRVLVIWWLISMALRGPGG